MLRYRGVEGWCNHLKAEFCEHVFSGQISTWDMLMFSILIFAPNREWRLRLFGLQKLSFEATIKTALCRWWAFPKKIFNSHFLCIVIGCLSKWTHSLVLTVFFESSGFNLPRGAIYVNGKLESRLPSARTVSWKLHHEDLYPSGNLAAQDMLGSDPTCAPEKRFGGCDSCHEPTCKAKSQPQKTCEFNQPCPKDKTTAARLGGNGALATHMVRKILATLCITF